jgi:hypothetical protein
MSKDVEIEVDYDSETVTITNPDGVYDYEMTKDIMNLVDFLVKGGSGYSVYSQEDEWLEELRRDPWTVI